MRLIIYKNQSERREDQKRSKLSRLRDSKRRWERMRKAWVKKRGD
jgi:hypothetical protein